MKLRPPICLIQSCLLPLAVGLGAYQPAAWAYGYHNIAGTACAAFNNAQADALERSHVRIYNPPTNYRALYVICPMQRVRDDIYNSFYPQGDPNYYPKFSVTAYFAAEVPVGTSVTCIFREFDNRTTHEPGDGLSVSYLINSQALTLTKSVGEGQSQSLWLEDRFNNETPDPGPGLEEKHYWTFTCALPPGTGINSIDVEQI